MSRLIHYLASPIDPIHKQKLDINSNCNDIAEYYPQHPYGFGMSENEVLPLLRGDRYGGLLERLGKNRVIIVVIIVVITIIIITIIIIIIRACHRH